MNHKNSMKGVRKSSYIFTAREHPQKGVMSTILGAISIVSVIAAIYLAYRNGGKSAPQHGAAVFLTTLFSLAGLVLGILSRIEKDKFYLFSYLGIALNCVALILISTILYAGAYGI